MRHLFSSGEILNRQNEKKLSEGLFIGDTLEYDLVAAETPFICHGEMDGRKVSVEFHLDADSFQQAQFRHMLGILMQTDIFEGVWTGYILREGDA